MEPSYQDDERRREERSYLVQAGSQALPSPVDSPRLVNARRRTRRRAWAKLVLAIISLGAITLAEVVGWYVGEATPLGGNLGYEAAGALSSVACLAALGGASLLSPTSGSLRTTWKTCWWFIAVSAAMMALDIWTVVAWGEEIAPDWALRLVETAALCLMIGVCEEAMLRGVLLEGLLAPLGRTKGGMWAAVIASSVFFGLLHIDFYELDPGSALEVAQAILKVAQTGVYGFSLACCVTCTHDVLSPALVHGLDDFLLLFGSSVLLGESTSDISYVATDTGEAVYTIVLYLVMITLYIPPAVRAARLLAAHDAPDCGALMARAQAEEEAVAAEAAQAGSARPWQCPGLPDQPYLPQPANRVSDRPDYSEAGDGR